MFAVVEILGKQFRVNQNDQIEVSKLSEEPGKTIKFDTVLLYGESESKAKVGQPYVSGASVEAKVIEHGKADKVRVFKFIAKKRHQTNKGHRQPYTKLEIIGIKG